MEQGHLIIIKKKNNNNRGNVNQKKDLHRPTLHRTRASRSGSPEVEILQDLSNSIACFMCVCGGGGGVICLCLLLVFPFQIHKKKQKNISSE